MSKVITAAKQAWSAKEQITRNIWLAGLGAYDKGYESATNTVTKGQSIFEELVERGRKLEAETTTAIHNKKEQIASVTASTSDSIQQKLHQTVTSITHIDANAFDSIIKKIEQIEVALADAKLSQEADHNGIIEQKAEQKAEQNVDKKVSVEIKTTPSSVAKISATPVDKTKAVAVVTKSAKSTTKKRVKNQTPKQK